MTRLEFGNEAHILMAQAGALKKDEDVGEAELKIEDGCSQACPYCTSIHYRCSNCGYESDEAKEGIITDPENRKRCRCCHYFLI